MPHSTANARLSRAAALALSCALALGACAADDIAGDGVAGDAGPATALPDVIIGQDTTLGSDALSGGTDTATTGVDTVVGGFGATKDEPGFLIPGNVAERAWPAAFGERVAWVERDVDGGGAPQLVLWDLGVGAPPRAFVTPNLRDPRALALGAAHLVYVDDRYGDDDVFAIDLATGAERAVVARPGAQSSPTITGSLVAWADCRACVTGDDGGGREIYRRNLPSGAEVRVTDDGVPDRAPIFGTLADGSAALAWIAGDEGLAVATPSGTVAFDAGRRVASLALARGNLVWRADPGGAIGINPDSMIPSDLFVTDIAAGATRRATLHAELAPGQSLRVSAADARYAWLDADPTTPDVGRVSIVDLGEDGDPVILRVARRGLRDAILGGDRLVFIAPRVDNADADDLWIGTLP